MWTPLFVKAPGQQNGKVVDDNVMSIDILPTIADTLGVEVPWQVDGRVADRAGERDQDVKYVDDDDDNYWRAAEGESLVRVPGTRATFEDEVVTADPVLAEGPDAVWRPTPHGALVGERVDDLDVGRAAPGDPVVDVADVDRLSDIDRDRPLPLEALGRSRLPDGDYVAYALNGTVATVAEVHEDPRADRALVLGLLRPDLFVDGENVLSAYLVDGEPGSEVLRPLSLADAR